MTDQLRKKHTKKKQAKKTNNNMWPVKVTDLQKVWENKT